MTVRLEHQVDVEFTRRLRFQRRDFLRAISVAGLTAGTLSWTDLMSLHAAELRKQGMACILLWMQGGPSQFETWSPKPQHANGGETKSIATSVTGINISENLPHTAKMMEEICLVRSMTSREGSHPRATFLMQTGYLPTASVKYPALGSVVAQQVGDTQLDLPSFVRIGARGRGAAGGGLLGVEFDAFNITNPSRAPDNTALTTSDRRYRRRLGLLKSLESDTAAQQNHKEVANHQKLYDKASKLVLSPKMNAFDISRESANMRDAYGESQFGAGCLLARRLVESGVTFVEVNAGNWDTHRDNFERSRELTEQVDRPYAQLLDDLRQRGMLDKTLVVWMGEFGRTPRINPGGGRDHFPRAFSLSLAGGGVHGGQVIGTTDAGGESVTDRPVSVSDLFRTICHSLQVDADHENMSNIGRPIKIVDGGEVVPGVLG
jgi:uncharacterized protein (DUF1501 family)